MSCNGFAQFWMVKWCFFLQITFICKVVYIFLNDYFYRLTTVQTYGKIMMNTKIQNQMATIYLHKSIQFKQDMYKPLYKYTY